MEKKLIAFTEDLLEKIGKFSQAHDISFTEAVRKLIELGLAQDTSAPESITFYDSLSKKIDELEKKFNLPERIMEKMKFLEKEIEKLSWWTCDDNTSRLGNLEVAHEELLKQLTVLTAASKLFKGHLKDRSIHLQD